MCLRRQLNNRHVLNKYGAHIVSYSNSKTNNMQAYTLKVLCAVPYYISIGVVNYRLSISLEYDVPMHCHQH